MGEERRCACWPGQRSQQSLVAFSGKGARLAVRCTIEQCDSADRWGDDGPDIHLLLLVTVRAGGGR
jgi:hypothetical protein